MTKKSNKKNEILLLQQIKFKKPQTKLILKKFLKTVKISSIV